METQPQRMARDRRMQGHPCRDASAGLLLWEATQDNCSSTQMCKCWHGCAERDGDVEEGARGGRAPHGKHLQKTVQAQVCDCVTWLCRKRWRHGGRRARWASARSAPTRTPQRGCPSPRLLSRCEPHLYDSHAPTHPRGCIRAMQQQGGKSLSFAHLLSCQTCTALTHKRCSGALLHCCAVHAT